MSSLRQHHGQQQEGHDGHVVAAGGQREGRGGEDGDDLEGAHLAATVGRAEPQRGGGDQQGGQAEEDPGIGQDDVVLLLARYAEHRHEGQVGQEGSTVDSPRAWYTTLPSGLVTS